jgi:thiamine pyrophosphate-dependent acetolactate synthase large subunit-like protein
MDFPRCRWTIPVSLGMVGMHGTVEANRALMNADLIISMGMRFDDRVTGNLNDFARDAKVIHVEIDPSEIDKNVENIRGLNADVAQVLNLLENGIRPLSPNPAAGGSPRSTPIGEIADQIKRRSKQASAGRGNCWSRPSSADCPT